MNKLLFHQNGFTRTSLSATVTRVSNFVEGNVSVVCFYIVKAPIPVDSITQRTTLQVKYVNCNALCMFKALDNFVSKNVILLNQVEGRLKSLKIQHRMTPD